MTIILEDYDCTNLKITKQGTKATLRSPRTTSDFTKKDAKIMTVIDNGNGYTVKSHSWSACYADKYHSLDYAEAEDLYQCLTALREYEE